MKMMKLRAGSWGWMVFAVVSMLLSSGCVSGRKVRSAEKMQHTNPIRNVAILGAGRVFYPRQAGKGVSLCSTQTDRALKALLAQTKAELTGKGYNVVFCEPAGIGFHDWSFPEYYAYSDLEHADHKVLHNIPDPVYVYPVLKARPDLEAAVRNLYEDFNESLAARKGNEYAPVPADVAVVKKYSGADAVVLLRVHGVEYTAERKVGMFMLGVAAGAFGSYGSTTPTETVEAMVVCVEASTGEVLWQSGLWIKDEPCKPNKTFMSQVLEPLPRAGATLDPKYVMK